MELPEILYKYTPAAAAIAVLQSGRLRWASPSTFNDVQEFRRLPHFHPSLAESVARYCDTLVSAAWGEISLDANELSEHTKFLLALITHARSMGVSREEVLDGFEQAKPPEPDGRFGELLQQVWQQLNVDAARVICLTTDPENSAMWAHYAARYTGCVLGFEPAVEIDSAFLAAKPVTYTDAVPTVGSGVDFLLYGNTPALRKRTLDAICLTKAASWSYECEWRVVAWSSPSTEPTSHTDYSFAPRELTRLILGPNISTADEASIRSALRERYTGTTIQRLMIEQGTLRIVDATEDSEDAAGADATHDA